MIEGPTLPVRLSDAAGVPYYRQVTRQVEALIAGGRLAPGTLLPSVRELAAQLRVSLITTRRAYADLEAAGLVVRQRGRGTFVAEGVDALSQERARVEARRLLREALAQARRLGLTDAERRALTLELLDEPPGDTP